MIYRPLLSLLLASCSLFAATPAPQSNIAHHKADARVTHARIFAIVPLIGAGTKEDPIRPAYAPGPRPRGTKFSNPDLTGIIGFNFVMSDDKKHALVEFVAHDRSAFKQIMADKDVKVFEKGK